MKNYRFKTIIPEYSKSMNNKSTNTLNIKHAIKPRIGLQVCFINNAGKAPKTSLKITTKNKLVVNISFYLTLAYETVPSKKIKLLKAIINENIETQSRDNYYITYFF